MGAGSALDAETDSKVLCCALGNISFGRGRKSRFKVLKALLASISGLMVKRQVLAALQMAKAEKKA